MNFNWDELYALQDRAIGLMRGIEQSFYLSGGTAISRGYYQHRYSEDLDFFVNDSPFFITWRDKCLDLLKAWEQHENWKLEVVLCEERFCRCFLYHKTTSLKLEFINDVPARIGTPVIHHTLGLLDTRENILANKITAFVDREEPKDMADIFWLCCEDDLDIVAGMQAAARKAAEDFPPLVLQELKAWEKQNVPDIVWIKKPPLDRFRLGVSRLLNRVQTQIKI